MAPRMAQLPVTLGVLKILMDDPVLGLQQPSRSSLSSLAAEDNPGGTTPIPTPTTTQRYLDKYSHLHLRGIETSVNGQVWHSVLLLPFDASGSLGRPNQR